MAKEEKNKKASVPEKKDEEKQRTPLTSKPAEIKESIPKPAPITMTPGTKREAPAPKTKEEVKTETTAEEKSAAAPAQDVKAEEKIETKSEATSGKTDNAAESAAAAASNSTTPAAPAPATTESVESAGSTDNAGGETDTGGLLSQLDSAARMAAGKIKMAGDQYYLDYTDQTREIERKLNDLDKKAAEAGKTYSQMVDGWIAARKEEEEAQRRRIEAQEKRDQRIRTWGGITEAAAALVNLMGTAHGAANQKWESPQNKWAERADSLRRERDKKLEDLRSQMKTLETQKAQLEYSFAADKASRDSKRAEILAGREDKAAQIQRDTNVAAAQVASQSATQKASLGMQMLNLAISKENRLADLNLRAQSNAADNGLKWANYQLNKDQKEFLQRSQGYDPQTKKWLNPETGKYDLDAPAVQKTPVFNAEDVDGSIRSLAQTNPDVMNELAKAMNFGSYTDYANAKNKDKEKAQKKYNSVYQLIRKFQDTEGVFKFSSTDLALLKQYAPEFYNQLMGVSKPASSADASAKRVVTTPNGKKVELDDDGMPTAVVPESEQGSEQAETGADGQGGTGFYPNYYEEYKKNYKKNYTQIPEQN